MAKGVAKGGRGKKDSRKKGRGKKTQSKAFSSTRSADGRYPI